MPPGHRKLLVAATHKLDGLCRKLEVMAKVGSSLDRPTAAMQDTARDLRVRLAAIEAEPCFASSGALIDVMRDVFSLEKRLEVRQRHTKAA